MKLHEKIEFKLRELMYQQDRKKKNKVVSGQQTTSQSEEKQGIKSKLTEAISEMDDYLGEQIQLHLSKKDK